MTTYTRVTVVGSVRKATMVVPNDEPLAAHLATIADAVAEPHSLTRLVVVDAAGVELDGSRSLTELEVIDGSPLRLLRTSEVPAPPEVSDVTDAVAHARDTEPTAWNERHRVVSASVVAGIGAFAALLALNDGASWAAFTVWGLAVVTAIVAGWGDYRAARAITAGAAVGASVVSALTATSWLPSDGGTLAGFALIGAAIWLTVTLAWGVGSRHRAALVGGAIGTVGMAALTALLSTGASAVHVLAIEGALAVVGIALVPTVALAVAGLTRLDDDASQGRRPTRDAIVTNVDQAFAVMSWAIAGLASVVAVAIAVLIASGELWAQLTGAALFMVVSLRTRVAPLAFQRWTLWAVTIVPLFAGLWVAGDTSVTAIVGTGLAVIAAACGLMTPTEHTRIRLRRWGDALETLAAIAIVPCIIGIYGVYGFMLEVF